MTDKVAVKFPAGATFRIRGSYRRINPITTKEFERFGQKIKIERFDLCVPNIFEGDESTLIRFDGDTHWWPLTALSSRGQPPKPDFIKHANEVSKLHSDIAQLERERDQERAEGAYLRASVHKQRKRAKKWKRRARVAGAAVVLAFVDACIRERNRLNLETSKEMRRDLYELGQRYARGALPKWAR